MRAKKDTSKTISLDIMLAKYKDIPRTIKLVNTPGKTARKMVSLRTNTSLANELYATLLACPADTQYERFFYLFKNYLQYTTCVTSAFWPIFQSPPAYQRSVAT